MMRKDTIKNTVVFYLLNTNILRAYFLKPVLCWIYSICQTLFYGASVYSLIYFSQQTCKVGLL